ncbi:uncharacterized protein TRIADDRAFT_23019 [Trichoplax adhaerens]|uniref:Enoyl reductase (ER) domain-containing protein n=1 Tax=Trichoplax adhaerens TaxID=10228 RepID=B3RR52_TRIAD|nr:hypothetical protein TRIADDRAFT_23019 [Trichoplax adhaerens]EDV26282.1 hypothetical protein TRIADDRAFT_23019 [Trichoplax adhaerens]|eukprot:XP_002110278.1 hypothetical protein TRIADDRAFT_23019 [Trichoplax adhaerens]
MRSVLVGEKGSLTIVNDTPLPSLKTGQILIKVAACGVNRMDLLQRYNKYPVPVGESEILGVEVAGTIAEMDEEALHHSNFKVGDRVCALVGGGGYADFCASPHQTVMPIPRSMSFVEASAIPEAFLTAYAAMFLSAKLKKDESILIHAGASGVGTAAIQLAKEFGNKDIFVTAGSEKKLAMCRELGATTLINYKTHDFAEVVRHTTNKRGVDVVVDFIGASYWERNIKSLALDGRLVLLGLLGNTATDGIHCNTGLILAKRLTIIGSTLRNRDINYKSNLILDFTRSTVDGFQKGRLKPVLDSTYTIEEVEAAHDRMLRNLNSGKIVLTM